MMKKKLLALILGFAMLFACAGCSGSSNPGGAAGEATAENPITIKVAFDLSTTHPWYAASEKFKEIVESESNGTMKVDIFANGSLAGSSREVQESVQIGSIECGLSSSSMDLLNPYQQIIGLPYLFEDVETVYEVLDGPIGQQIASHVEGEGIKILSFWEDGMRQITNNVRPINTPADLAGVKLRIPDSTVRLDTFNALGASPVVMGASEVFSALETGTIDGQENAVSVVKSSSYYECQKYLSMTNHVYGAASFIINLDLWNSLTEEQQNILQKAADAGRDLNRQINMENDAAIVVELQEKGMEINEIADIEPFREACAPVYEKVLAELGDEGQQIYTDILNLQK